MVTPVPGSDSLPTELIFLVVWGLSSNLVGPSKRRWESGVGLGVQNPA